MSADTVTGPKPYAQKRGTTPSTIGIVRQVIMPDWHKGFTVEAPAGGSPLKMAISGTDDQAIGSDFVDIIVGAGPRLFPVHAPSIYIASTVASADYVVEAELPSK